MAFAMRKNTAVGEIRLAIRFQAAWINADISMRIMANSDKDVPFHAAVWLLPALTKSMVRYVDTDGHMKVVLLAIEDVPL